MRNTRQPLVNLASEPFLPRRIFLQNTALALAGLLTTPSKSVNNLKTEQPADFTHETDSISMSAGFAIAKNHIIQFLNDRLVLPKDSTPNDFTPPNDGFAIPNFACYSTCTAENSPLVTTEQYTSIREIGRTDYPLVYRYNGLCLALSEDSYKNQYNQSKGRLHINIYGGYEIGITGSGTTEAPTDPRQYFTIDYSLIPDVKWKQLDSTPVNELRVYYNTQVFMSLGSENRIHTALLVSDSSSKFPLHFFKKKDTVA